MLRDFCCGPCLGNRSSDDPDVDRDPVLLVSGIGGSILHSKGKKFGFETRVWVRLLLADLEFKKKIWSVYNPKTGYTEALDKSSEIVVPDDDYGLYAIDILDPSWLFSKFVSKWICIACPFQGAPGCVNDALLTGLQFVEGFESNFFVSRWTMHQLLVECPSVYEMLANPDFKWEKQPQIKVWRKQTDDEEICTKLESYGPVESISFFEAALRNNELNYDGNKVALPFNYSILKWASGTRHLVNNAQLPEGITFYNIYGTSFDTPFDVCYGTETSPIEDLSEVCQSMPEYSYVDGDGTVPAESAKADWFPAAERVGVAASHRGLLCDKTVFQHIQKWLGVKQSVSKHPRKSKVADASPCLPGGESALREHFSHVVN
ncbi:hypothetical protein Tsubulata_024392 [Turnera subulata]|uniref:Phospholipase A(1) LCAT3 n=1 Tax=Turnera subulata TaxID=218843 RepID=A0A9Q0J204_9ROSI|nr:hypothetical protein Tsubulata_024392 [Turnera subulata]